MTRRLRVRMSWLCAVTALVVVAVATNGAGASGSSLRGALEALQRRQRGSGREPLILLDRMPSESDNEEDTYLDYDETPHQSREDLANMVLENIIDAPEEKYFVDYLSENDLSKIPKSDKNTVFRERLENEGRILTRELKKRKRASPFRERGQKYEKEENDVKNMFLNKVLDERYYEDEMNTLKEEKDRKYLEVLDELLKKYKGNNKFSEETSPTDEVIWLYNNIDTRKRQVPMAGWGPVAFKKHKRNSVHSSTLRTNANLKTIDPSLLEEIKEQLPRKENNYADFDDVPNIPPYDISNGDNPDITEEIAIAFQPLDSQKIEYLQRNGFSYDPIKEKRFSVTKRSSNERPLDYQQLLNNINDNQYKIRLVRGGLGTKPKVLKDLSDVFGNYIPIKQSIKKKRSESPDNNYHETKSPQISALSHNSTHSEWHNNNRSMINEKDKYNNHQNAPHAIRLSSETNIESNEAKQKRSYQIPEILSIGKRSIQWSDYFGIDKRKKKSIPISQDFLKKRFSNIFKSNVTPQLESDEKEKDKLYDHFNSVATVVPKESFFKNNKFQKNHSTKSYHTTIGKKQSSDNKSQQSIMEKTYQKILDNGHKNKYPKNMETITIGEVLHNDNDDSEKTTTKLLFNDSLSKYKRDIHDNTLTLSDNPTETTKKLKIFDYLPIIKRSSVPADKEEVNDFKLDRATILAIEEKREPKRFDPVKLDNIDNKLKSLELEVVEDASSLGEHSEDLDSKEEQEMRERILSRLAAAYSLEKMRKALKEFKHSLAVQKNLKGTSPPPAIDQVKEKRVSSSQNNVPEIQYDTQKNTNKISDNSDTALDKYFESEQGAGQFSNGNIETSQFSEGYMGGSGRKEEPDQYYGNDKGSCPSLDKIVNKCRRIDVLAGDHGHLFLPLCSLHQICYICGTLSETGCDLVFISEADTLCNNKNDCLQAARNTIMLLRELHESMADNLDGECENNPCLRNTLQYSPNWWSRT